jgi:hypothetical protein
MTPHQKLKHLALVQSGLHSTDGQRVVITEDNVDELYDSPTDEDYDQVRDTLCDIREGEIETEVPCERCHHYESKSVAAKTPDGSWVGWTYWYGGGKHGEPEGIPWIEKAYNLDCTEEEKLVTVRTFTKKG